MRSAPEEKGVRSREATKRTVEDRKDTRWWGGIGPMRWEGISKLHGGRLQLRTFEYADIRRLVFMEAREKRAKKA